MNHKLNDAVRRMVKDGFKISAIADELGLTPKMVSGIIARHHMRQTETRVCILAGCNTAINGRGSTVVCSSCSEAANAKIRILHAEGHSAASMAPLIGLDRGNIASRMKSMYLRSNGSSQSAMVPTIEPVARTRQDSHSLFGFTLPGVVTRRPAMPIPPVRECQWIDGDPRTKPVAFCCKPVVARSLCAGHFAISYVPNRPRLAADAA